MILFFMVCRFETNILLFIQKSRYQRIIKEQMAFSFSSAELNFLYGETPRGSIQFRVACIPHT